MSKGQKQYLADDNGSLSVTRAPYLTCSGHVRYANKSQIKILPIDFNTWVSVFEQDVLSVRAGVMNQLSTF